MKILVAGASGLIGGQVVDLLAEKARPDELHLIGRKKLPNVHESVSEHVFPTDKWRDISNSYTFDVGICCLGSTLAKAGSKDAFAAIDRDLVLEFASISKACGAKRFITISSVGASAKAANFYLSVKGAAEEGLRKIGFDRLDIMQPGLLRGNRAEHRFGERLAIFAAPLTDALMHGPLRRYRSIDSATVAKAVANLISETAPGVFIHGNDDMVALAG